MGVVEFELQRTVRAPIAQVFARLADITGYGAWMPRKASILRRTQQTSPGEPGLGTTYLDATSFGPTPGEIIEFQPPHTLVFHWWDSSRGGRVKVEGWPGYTLKSEGADTTLVRHHATLHTYGSYRLATPVLRRIALRERTTTIEALRASFDPSGV
ncbi:SRPBCC family protein [Nocardioides sp.]|uniref:SRPBCC family protein n=1 Tax=Nocardioides sp. TaxID=35761 RepID=UPI002ED0B430